MTLYLIKHELLKLGLPCKYYSVNNSIFQNYKTSILCFS